jgi:hypothetical protein
MNEITKFGSANLPTAQSLAQSLRAASSAAATSGAVILKMDKTGHWVYGGEQTEIEDDSLWAVNPLSFVHGFIAWGEGQPLGEKMGPVSQPLPEVDGPPPGAKNGWETQVGFSLKCITGEDAGMEARFTTVSVGGKKAWAVLALAVSTQVEKDETKPVPVVLLKKGHYAHKKYGKVFTPDFEVVKWVSMAGPAAAAPAAEAEPEAEEPAPAETGRRRRRAA